MAKNSERERACALCEYGQEICEGNFCICRKKGVVPPDGVCRHFQFDPLKIKVTARKLPEFRPLSGFFEQN